MIDFLLSKHFVISLYILEIAAVSALFVTGMLLAGRDKKYRVFRALGVVMVLRLIIKLIYFYVEFYVASWPLNILINVAMDGSYVISMLICVRLISFHVERRRGEGREIRLAAAFCYIFVWMVIQIFAVDPASNHNIIFSSSRGETVYFLNELFFYLVFLYDLVRCSALLSRRRRENNGWYLFFIICCGAYISYVFIWDISFVVPSIAPVRHSKPLDGVLIFSIGLFLFYFLTEARDIRSLFISDNPEPAAPSIAIGEVLDPLPYANAHSLSAREKEVLALVAKGRTNNEIAGALFITDNTVKRHLTSIYKKCGAVNRTQLLFDIVEWHRKQ